MNIYTFRCVKPKNSLCSLDAALFSSDLGGAQESARPVASRGCEQVRVVRIAIPVRGVHVKPLLPRELLLRARGEAADGSERVVGLDAAKKKDT